MIRCLMLILLIFMASAQIVLADPVTVYLKNGRKIQGEIISQDQIRVKINVGGIPYTYYRDEIEKIDDGKVKGGTVPLADLVDKSLRGVENIPAAKREVLFR